MKFFHIHTFILYNFGNELYSINSDYVIYLLDPKNRNYLYIYSIMMSLFYQVILNLQVDSRHFVFSHSIRLLSLYIISYCSHLLLFK